MTREEKREKMLLDFNEITNNTLSSKLENLFNYWEEVSNEYGGIDINNFPNAKKACELAIPNENEILPILKPNWENNLTRTTTCYLIVVDGVIKKIGSSGGGIKSQGVTMYFNCFSGTPSKRSSCGYTYLLGMLKNGHKVEFYYIDADIIKDVSIQTISDNLKIDMPVAPLVFEKLNLNAYKTQSLGKVPFLNFQERHEKYPKIFDDIHMIIEQKNSKTKKYSEIA